MARGCSARLSLFRLIWRHLASISYYHPSDDQLDLGTHLHIQSFSKRLKKASPTIPFTEYFYTHFWHFFTPYAFFAHIKKRSLRNFRFSSQETISRSSKQIYLNVSTDRFKRLSLSASWRPHGGLMEAGNQSVLSVNG